MTTRTTTLALAAGLLLTSACWAKDAAPVAVPEAGPGQGRLVFVPARRAYEEFSAPLVSAADAGPDAAALTLAKLDGDANLYVACGGTEPNKDLLIALASWAISKITSWVVGQIDVALQDEVNRYTTSRSATASADFYDVLSNGKGLTAKSTACMRATFRGSDPKDPKSAATLLADVVVLVSYDPQVPEVVTMRPLRLFYSRIDTPTKDAKVAAGFKLSADVMARHGGATIVQKSVIDQSLGKAIYVDLKEVAAKGYFYRVYPVGETRGIDVPLPAWNDVPAAAVIDAHRVVGDGGAQQWAGTLTYGPDVPRHNRMTATITLTEVGNVPWFLKNLAALVHDNKDGIAQDIAGEITSAAGLQSSGSSGKTGSKK